MNLLSKHAKTIIYIVVVLLAMIAARAAYNYLYYTLPPQLVSITIKYSPESPCREDSPLYMQILNAGYREVVGASFTLSVKVDEHSESIAQLLSSEYSTDAIVRARSSHEGCWSYPKLYSNEYAPDKLLYEAKDQLIKFDD